MRQFLWSFLFAHVFSLCLVVPLLAEEKPAEESKSKLREFQEAGLPDEILFCLRKPSLDGHWYGNIGYYALDHCRYTFPKNSGGKLCVYNVKTKECRTIFEDPHGNIRDPQIHYDCEKLIFSYLPAGKNHYSLFEINLDGTNLRRLTGEGEDIPPQGMENAEIYPPAGWDDIEPTYLPDDQIIFCSSRAKRYVQCWLSQVATVHKCNSDGTNIRALSANVEQDNTPWVLPNGQVIYMRWEYVDRNHLTYHHLWTMNPDGTRQMVFYGNQKPGGVFLGPKPIPGTSMIVATFSPGHGMKEHYGRVAIFDPRRGPDDPKGVTYVSQKNTHSDPWAFSENHFMVCSYSKILLLSRDGSEETLYELPEELRESGYWINEARPVMKRERERVIADTTDPTLNFGTLALINVYKGRQMQDVPPGTIKELLIYEVLPKPLNYSGAMSEMSSGGTFSVERLLGSVPVSEEGSAYFRIPPLRSVLFVAMDGEGRCVKRMHSFTSVMPGEVTVCIGCHEERLETPDTEDRGRLNKIMRQPPVEPTPVAGVPEIFDFPRDIQPILDKHCLECHNHDREEGGFNISGDWGPLYSIGYQQMSWRRLFGDNRIVLPYRLHERSNFKPYEIGTGSSRLLQLIEEGHEGVNMSEPEKKMIRYWLDAGANYAGTYAVNSWGSIGHYLMNVNQRQDRNWSETQAYEDVLARRCDECHVPTEADKKIGTFNAPAQFYVTYYPYETHQKNMYLARSMSQDGGRYNRHLIFNLSYPERSKVARAPLSKAAGGLGVCEAKGGKVIFADKSDPDYEKIVAYVARGRKFILEECNRWCMITPSVNNGEDCPVRFVPRPQYVREMIRYGILPPDWDFKASVDPFKLDEAYWRSLWYVPAKE
ncbi:MAG: hypothetical protein Q4D38_10420 [Planctomycetia bacterium]|nr:hypothetical protein [Planctomycetia bacterium]